MKAVKILSIENATRNVMHVKTEKPQGMTYLPGQAVDVAINSPKWKDELRPFTFTSLNSDMYLEFFIKTYPDHKGVTKQIAKLINGDSLLIGDVFGDIRYEGEGIFIAGGAGITPFMAILKDLDKNNSIGANKLIFANNTAEDIIGNDFFTQLLGKNFVNVLSKEENKKYEHGYITKELIESQLQNDKPHFYLCGPPPMMDAVLKQLKELGVEESRIVKEVY
ncbi:FAD-binding oxidoreductase [Flavobacterium sp.]